MSYLFSNNLESGIVYGPNIAFARNIILNLITNKRIKEGCIQIMSPSLIHKSILKKSGHMDNFEKNMFMIDDHALKPMNCPNHALFVKNLPRDSKLYHENILRIFETTNLFRKENTGDLLPLLRNNTFAQDDIHTFLKLEEDIEKVVLASLEEWNILYKQILNLSYRIVFGTCSVSNDESKRVDQKMLEIIEKSQLEYIIEEGNGAFYAPKLDLQINVNGKWIQLSTIQIDYYLCQKFDIKHFNFVIHTALLGSFERFMYILLQTNNNSFPFWCDVSPFALINLTREENEYCQKILSILSSMGKTQYYDGKDIQTFLSENSASNIYFVGAREIQNHTLSNIKKETIDLSVIYKMYDIFLSIKKFFMCPMNILDFCLYNDQISENDGTK